MFGRSVVSSCPVAEQSTVWIHKASPVHCGDLCAPGVQCGDLCAPGVQRGNLCAPGVQRGDLCAPGVQRGDLCAPGVQCGDQCAPGCTVESTSPNFLSSNVLMSGMVICTCLNNLLFENIKL